MGTVFRVSDETGRHLALKLLAPSTSPEAHARFGREGQVTASLKHPGIVGIHATGAAGAQPYLVYELVEGTNLEECFSQLDREERLDVILQVARALGYAHEHGVVHRDVKLANILIGEDQRVLVADFGLAQAAGLERLTQTGALMGTPMSMAPEQLAGKSGDYAPHTDVWALGVLLYEALTDSVPFPGETLVVLMAQIVSATPRPPRADDPSVPEAVQEVCLKALQKSPSDRYRDGNAFAEALEAARGEHGLARVRRRRWLALGLGALSTALLLSVGFVGAEPKPERSAETASNTSPDGFTPAPDEGSAAPKGLPQALEAALVKAAEGAPLQVVSALERVADDLRQYPDEAARVDAIRLARARRAQKLGLGSADLPLELKVLGALTRCRAPAAQGEDAELLATLAELRDSVLSLVGTELKSRTGAVDAANSVLDALAASGISLTEGALNTGVKLSDSYLDGIRAGRVTGAQYLDGLVALARLDVALEQCHLLLYMTRNPLRDSRSWLGAAAQDPVRRAVQLLIQTRPSDASRSQRFLRKILDTPTPAWGPRLKARVLGFVCSGELQGLALSRLRKARQLDPNWPWPLRALTKAELEAGQYAQALESAEQALALHYARGYDKRFGTRHVAPWLQANAVEALVGLERYDEAGEKLDALFADQANASAILDLEKRGVLTRVVQKLGRTFDWKTPEGRR